MVTRLLSYSFLFNVGLGSSAVAQQAAGPSLAAIALPGKQATPANAAAPAATPAKPLFSPDSIFINPQVLPQFMGGNAAFAEYLKNNLRYSPEAKRQHLTGTVVVNFVLSATGLVTYATVLRGPGKVLNEEALRLVWHMPAWQPARQHGQPVRVSCSIPVKFEE